MISVIPGGFEKVSCKSELGPKVGWFRSVRSRGGRTFALYLHVARSLQCLGRLRRLRMMITRYFQYYCYVGHLNQPAQWKICRNHGIPSIANLTPKSSSSEALRIFDPLLTLTRAVWVSEPATLDALIVKSIDPVTDRIHVTIPVLGSTVIPGG